MNTALKGIIGVKAMAEIAHVLDEDSDATEYAVSALVKGSKSPVQDSVLSEDRP